MAEGGPAAALAALGRLAEEGAASDNVRGYLLTALAKLVAQVLSLAPMLVFHYVSSCVSACCERQKQHSWFDDCLPICTQSTRRSQFSLRTVPYIFRANEP